MWLKKTFLLTLWNHIFPPCHLNWRYVGVIVVISQLKYLLDTPISSFMTSSVDLIKDLEDFVSTKGSAATFYCKLCVIHANCHQYLNQWENLIHEVDLVKDIISTVCRMDASFQLNGFGMWLFYEMLSHLGDDKEFCALFANLDTAEEIIRIGMEHPVHDKCYMILLQLCEDKYLRFKDIYQIGNVFNLKFISFSFSHYLFTFFFL